MNEDKYNGWNDDGSFPPIEKCPFCSGSAKLCDNGYERPVIDPDKCRGCTACARKCPVGAISGALRETHRIDADKCIRCGACKTACKFNAVTGF